MDSSGGSHVQPTGHSLPTPDLVSYMNLSALKFRNPCVQYMKCQWYHILVLIHILVETSNVGFPKLGSQHSLGNIDLTCLQSHNRIARGRQFQKKVVKNTAQLMKFVGRLFSMTSISTRQHPDEGKRYVNYDWRCFNSKNFSNRIIYSNFSKFHSYFINIPVKLLAMPMCEEMQGKRWECLVMIKKDEKISKKKDKKYRETMVHL